ncbi:hypothetical protein GALMADRAFT_240652 [Galerina marginata CBS 339.88]|uniref:G domain-containing protein n=1 Tax=Galerina marginata (strain CBS 339.88) TaxID=685588 RepID=A0A067TQD6_GALM3|nr:hypothetical protein GALMADRAFT_240652 [Galerina marginata CBS 339.88]
MRRHGSKPTAEDGELRDIVIPVMGPTGAGKSTFINALLQDERLSVGHYLTSCTSELQVVEIESFPGNPPFNGRNLILVDTPGFNDTYEDDEKILHQIAEWLERAYRNSKMVLGGVIYLHDISSDRFSGTARRNLEIFQHFCGEAAFSKTVIGTTKWGRKADDFSAMHEEELRSVHWKSMIKKGSTVCRFLGDYESARSFVDVILRRMARDTALQIQVELAVDHKALADTKAGKGLRLHQILELQAQILGLETAVAVEDDEEAEQKLKMLREKMQHLVKKVQDAKTPLPRRFRVFLGI